MQDGPANRPTDRPTRYCIAPPCGLFSHTLILKILSLSYKIKIETIYG